MQHSYPGAHQASQREHRPAPGAGLVPEMVAQWPRIVLRDTTVVIPSTGDRSQRTVRACIHLGSLLPVDVRVALVPIRDSVPDFAMAHQMWSTESYHNGTYLYEVTLPVAALAGGNCAVRVTPARGLPLWRDILRVIETSIACPAAVFEAGEADDARPRVEHAPSASTFP